MTVDFYTLQIPKIDSKQSEYWLKKAESLLEALKTTEVHPKGTVEPVSDPDVFQGWRMAPQEEMADVCSRTWGHNESFTIDFGDYVVGYLSIGLSTLGILDAPLRLKFTFGETAAEVAEPFDPYNGAISRSWLQDEIICLDTLPQQVRLPRRYAFRYVKIEILDAAQLQVTSISCESVSSAVETELVALPDDLPAVAYALDKVSLRTLACCMQTVFEDGPKRDRRLWMGDLRLQAITNYVSYGNNDLVKRCLYLFSALANETDVISACLYESPVPQAGTFQILDYVALFVPTLLDYLEASDDWETAAELWPVALRQLEAVLAYVNGDGLFVDPGDKWIFIDWRDGLDKQASMHGVILYCLRQGIELAKRLNVTDQAVRLENISLQMEQAAKRDLFDNETGLFVSGPDRQVSWASQIWMILGEAVSREEGTRILKRLFESPGAIRPVSPYLYHHAVQAMVNCELFDEARSLLESYWGGMMEKGALTFWEVYDPRDDLLSPYNSHLVNSYCHAWSCTPAYFIRTYPEIFGDRFGAPPPSLPV